MTDTSIIIVTYNSENEIEGCLNSILSNFDDNNIEIIIADNNSSDSTIDIIQNISSDKIMLITNSNNLGYTKAINQCLENVSLGNILILNPDTIIPDDSLKQLINTLALDDSNGIVAPQLKYPNGDIQKSCRRFPRRRDIIYESFGLNRLFSKSKEFGHWKMSDFDHKNSRFVEQPAGAALLMKKRLINEIGNFDENFPMFFSDVDFCHRVIDKGYKIKFSTDTFIIHKGGASVFQNRVRMIVSSHISFWKYFTKYNTGLFNQVVNLFIGLFLFLLIPIRILLTVIQPFNHRNSDNVL